MLAMTADEFADEIDKIARSLERESPLGCKNTRRFLAEDTARLHCHLRVLSEKQAAGNLPAEEARTMPAVASQILRNLKALKTTLAMQEDDDGF